MSIEEGPQGQQKNENQSGESSSKLTKKQQAAYDNLTSEGKAHVDAQTPVNRKAILATFVRGEGTRKKIETSADKKNRRTSQKQWSSLRAIRRR